MDTCFRPYELITKQRMSLVTAKTYRLLAPHGTNRWARSIHLTLILMISKSRSEKSQKASGAISCAFHQLQLPAIPFHVTWFLMIICFLFAISFGWKSKLRSIQENLETKFNVKKRSRKQYSRKIIPINHAQPFQLHFASIKILQRHRRELKSKRNARRKKCWTRREFTFSRVLSNGLGRRYHFKVESNVNCRFLNGGWSCNERLETL